MDDVRIEGNPGWVDDEAGDADVILSAIGHGGSVASITLEAFSHRGDPKVEVGAELTKGDCRRLGEFLLLRSGADLFALLDRISTSLAYGMTEARADELQRDIVAWISGDGAPHQ